MCRARSLLIAYWLVVDLVRGASKLRVWGNAEGSDERTRGCVGWQVWSDHSACCLLVCYTCQPGTDLGASERERNAVAAESARSRR